jgi:hypothetical protein
MKIVRQFQQFDVMYKGGEMNQMLIGLIHHRTHHNIKSLA